jgi:membrane-associated phospholipid phosphatase
MATNRMTSRNALEPRESRDLRVPGWLARRPGIGVLMILVGTLIFGTLAYNVWTKGPLLQWDIPLNRELHTEAVKTPWRIIELLIFGFFVGKELVQVLMIILGLYFLHKRFWRELAMLLVGLGGGALIWYLLIGIFNRPRPTAQIGIVVSDPSFPSGHVITAVLFYGFLAYLFVPKMPNLFWKWVVVIAAILTMLYIGFSRLFLGGHYLTDLLAGYALGVAWAGLVYTLIERLFWRRKVSRLQ